MKHHYFFITWLLSLKRSQRKMPFFSHCVANRHQKQAVKKTSLFSLLDWLQQSKPCNKTTLLCHHVAIIIEKNTAYCSPCGLFHHVATSFVLKNCGCVKYVTEYLCLTTSTAFRHQTPLVSHHVAVVVVRVHLVRKRRAIAI